MDQVYSVRWSLLCRGFTFEFDSQKPSVDKPGTAIHDRPRIRTCFSDQCRFCSAGWALRLPKRISTILQWSIWGLRSNRPRSRKARLPLVNIIFWRREHKPRAQSMSE
ncbi:hypothetical protein BDW59DRAFT_147843 [Aspergillus cavernicola]|uniref:Uncharacterized protein n=1 Tax=Aspergillus cavernicola TaxID=176166 RepID=A0ABR4I8M7_9EURO